MRERVIYILAYVTAHLSLGSTIAFLTLDEWWLAGSAAVVFALTLYTVLRIANRWEADHA